MTDNYHKVLDSIKKNYKNTEFLLDIYLSDYHDNYIYIRLDYYKKSKSYKLSWLDLKAYNNNFESIVSYEWIPIDNINFLKEIISKIPESQSNIELNDKYLVTLNSNLEISNGEKFNLSFNRFIPTNNTIYLDTFITIFNNLPKKLAGLMDELMAGFVGKINKYEYNDPFAFDLFNDDLATIFDEEIINRGKSYCEEGRVLFLEKVGDSYYSVVGGKSLYVIIIKYNDKDKIMQVYCTCPCEFYCKHIYATIVSIRNKKFRKFYKITSNNDIPLLDKVMNFQYLLTIGIDDANMHYIVIENGELRLLPVLDNEGKSNWVVLEDDKKNTLTNRLNKIIK